MKHSIINALVLFVLIYVGQYFHWVLSLQFACIFCSYFILEYKNSGRLINYILPALLFVTAGWLHGLWSGVPTQLLPMALSFGTALLAFLLFYISQKVRYNKLGSFNLLLIWTTIEYLLFQYQYASLEYSSFGLIIQVANKWPALPYIGISGAFLMLLFVNWILSKALLSLYIVKEWKFKWRSLLASALFVGIIALTVLFPYENTGWIFLDPETETTSSSVPFYSKHGEWFGRTLVWVMVFLSFYIVTKYKTSKK